MWKNVGYYDGKIGPLEEMTVPMGDRTLYFGDGIYEAAMGRLGFVWREGTQTTAMEDIRALCALPGLHVEGMYTHFAATDENMDYTELQSRRFQEARSMLKEAGVDLNDYHCASSAALLSCPWTHIGKMDPESAENFRTSLFRVPVFCGSRNHKEIFN